MSNKKYKSLIALVLFSVAFGCSQTEPTTSLRELPAQTSVESMSGRKADQQEKLYSPAKLGPSVRNDGTRPADFVPPEFSTGKELAAKQQYEKAAEDLERQDARIEAERERDYYLNSIDTRVRSAEQKVDRLNLELADLEKEVENATKEERNSIEIAMAKREIRDLEGQIEDRQASLFDLEKALNELKQVDVLTWEDHRIEIDRLLFDIR